MDAIQQVCGLGLGKPQFYRHLGLTALVLLPSELNEGVRLPQQQPLWLYHVEITALFSSPCRVAVS